MSARLSVIFAALIVAAFWGTVIVAVATHRYSRHVEQLRNALFVNKRYCLKRHVYYAAKHSSDTTVYDCETNPCICTHNEKNYEAGQAVRLMGPQFGIDGRLPGFKVMKKNYTTSTSQPIR